MGIQYRKKKKGPPYAKKQLDEVSMRAGRLYRTLTSSDVQLIMNYEKFFSLINESVPTNRGFYTTDTEVSPAEVKFKRTQKYSAKVMVWIASSEKGISEPFFAKQHQSVNEEMYLKHCIKVHLMPFINHYHDPNKVIFWPDLASSHYASSVIDFSDEQKIELVPKEKNPQNCPQARPVETLWQILEEKIYADGWEAKTIDQLKRRIQTKVKEVDMTSVQAMFSSIPQQL